MAQRSVFDSLVADLSIDERRDLLERMSRSYAVSEEPLYPDEALAAAKKPHVPESVSEFGLLRRIVLFLRRLFTGRDLEELLEEDELKAIGRSVEARCPGLVDWRRGVLTAAFLEELRRLRDSARFFYDVLDRSFDRDRPSFFAFLASIELPETHGFLLSRTNPFTYAEEHPEAEEGDVRQAVLAEFDEAFVSLPDEKRRRMYQDLRCLIFLKRLAGFLFERLTSLWRQAPGEEEGPTASFVEVAELLIELGDILFSLRAPPTIELMESLFVFSEHEEFERPDFDAEGSITADLGKAEAALGRIRSFNQKVPLVDIVRLVTENPSHAPRELAAGEDWLVVYKGFWKTRIEGMLDELRDQRRYKRLADDIASFIGEAPPATYSHISREEGRDSPPIRQDLALAFLDAFSRGTFAKELSRPLKIVLVDGEFYRKENRVEFTDAFETLNRAGEAVSALDARLAPEGEIGMAWVQARLEMAPIAIKRRKIQSVARSAEEEAERIVRNFAYALAEMLRILRGILKGEAGGRYDSLANLSYLDGKANKEFMRSLGNAKDKCERALGLLTELSGLDLARVEE
jgi:hypothetical protein